MNQYSTNQIGSINWILIRWLKKCIKQSKSDFLIKIKLYLMILSLFHVFSRNFEFHDWQKFLYTICIFEKQV